MGLNEINRELLFFFFRSGRAQLTPGAWSGVCVCVEGDDGPEQQ